jgi:hypothetical protein
MSRLHRSLVALVVLVSALAAAPSRAATPDPLQRARDLFVQGEADEDADRWSEALEKFRAVSQVKLTAGVRYHVALCEEHLGQLARALRDYRAAEQQARIDNARDVLRTVGRELAALDPRVPRLTIRVAPALPNTSVKLDGEQVAEALAGAAIPVDPGVHYVEARTPGRPTATQGVVLQEGESRMLEVSLAPLASAPTPNPAPPPTERTATEAVEMPPPSPSSNRVAPLIATAISVGLAGAGVAAFLAAGGALDHAHRMCASLPTLAPDACDNLKTPVRAWDFAAGGAWLGALAAGAVAVVLWTKHHPTSSETTISGTRSAPAHTGVLIGPAPLGVGGQF